MNNLKRSLCIGVGREGREGRTPVGGSLQESR